MVSNKSMVIDLDRVTPQDIISIHVNDINSIFLYLTITKSGVTQDVSGCTVEYDATLANIVAEQDAAGSISNNQVVIPVTSNMVAISGLLEIDVRLIEGTAELHTQTIRMNVCRSVIDGSASIDISGTTIYARIDAKADKVSGATNGNFAALDSDGNLTDSEFNEESFVRWDEEVDRESLSNGTYMVPSSAVVRAELGKTFASVITLNKSAWVEQSMGTTYYTQDVTLEGVTASTVVVWSFGPNSSYYGDKQIILSAVSADTLRFICLDADKPTSSIKVSVICKN